VYVRNLTLTKEAIRPRILYIVAILVVVLFLTGCGALTRLRGIDLVQLQRVESGMAEARQNLYVPADAVQLVERKETGLRGTIPGCLGGRLEIVYGINRPFEQVLEEYEQALLENGWEELYDSGDEPWAILQRGPKTFLQIDAKSDWSLLSTVDPSERKRFQVLYHILLDFRDPSFGGCSG
jgi:hypothetical protein